MWKKANVVPVHKKEDKMSAKNYCLISSFTTFGKMFHRVNIIPFSTIFYVIDF